MTKELSFTLCSTCVCAAVGGPWNHDAKYLMDQHGLLGLRGLHNCHLSVICVRFSFVSCCWPCGVGVLAVLVSGVMQLSAPCLLLGFTGATAQTVLASKKLSHSFLFSSWEATVCSCRITVENVKSFEFARIWGGREKAVCPITEINFMRVSQDKHLTPLHHMFLLYNVLNTEKKDRWQSKSKRRHQQPENKALWSLSSEST